MSSLSPAVRGGTSHEVPVKQEPLEEASASTDRAADPTAISGGPVVVSVGSSLEAGSLSVKKEKDMRSTLPVKKENDDTVEERPSPFKRREKGS